MMKLSIVLLLISILQAQEKEAGIYIECYTNVDCKLLGFVKEAIESGKVSECEGKGVTADVTKCQLEAYGLSKEQAELNLKILPYTLQCNPKPDTEIKTCNVRCTKQNDRDSCLENCALPLKIKFEECLSKLAGKSTENASKNAKCVMSCDKNSYSEIFDCSYNCNKEAFDTLASKNSGKEDNAKGSGKLNGDSEKSNGGESKSSSSGSQAKPTGSSQPQSGSSGQSSAYLTAQVSSLAKTAIIILITLFLL